MAERSHERGWPDVMEVLREAKSAMRQVLRSMSKLSALLVAAPSDAGAMAGSW